MTQALHPIIVIEGPDGTGKTTLANALCERLGATYRHLTYRWPDHMYLYHWAAIEQCLKDAERGPVILDRWWASELVYAAAFRGGTRWPWLHKMLDRVGLKHRVFYVLAQPDDRTKYIDHFEQLKGKRVEMFDSMTKVYDLFRDWHHTMKGRMDFMTYDFMRDAKSPEDFALTVDHIMQEAYDWHAGNHGFALDVNDRRAAGQLVCPDILLIGDKSNQKTRRPVWPFFDVGHSSDWVTSALHRAGIPEHKVAWVNAHGSTGKLQITRSMIDAICPKHIITMGCEAQRAAHALDLDVDWGMGHPQWYRRFHPKDGQIEMGNIARKFNLKPENWNDSSFSNLGVA